MIDWTVNTPETTLQLIGATLSKISGVPLSNVVAANRTDPRPKGEWIVFWFNEIEPLGQLNGDSDGEEAETVFNSVWFNESRCTVSVEYIGLAAFNKATNILHNIESNARYADIWQFLGFSGYEPVRDVSVPYESFVQERAEFTLYFYTCFGKKFPADFIDTVRLNLTLR